MPRIMPRAVLRIFAGLLSATLLPSIASAQLSTDVIFNPADSSRAYMDVGGAWNGTADASSGGDRFDVSITNTDTENPIYLNGLMAGLPTGFTERITSLNAVFVGSGCGVLPSITGTRIGDDIVFNLGAPEIELPVGCQLNLDFGLVSLGTTTAGTYAVDINAEASTVSGGAADLTSQSTVNYLLKAGSLTIEKTPSITNAAIGDNVDWTVTVTNSGLGGLFDVNLDESALAGQAGLSLTSIIPTAPLTPIPNVSGDRASVGYLAPSEKFIATVSADVLQCSGLTNTAIASERNGQTSDSASASVKLDLKTPNVSFNVSTTNVPFNGTGTITVNFTNNGDGVANSFLLSTNIESAAVDFVSASPGWTYSNGNLIKTTGAIAAGATETLVINVKDSGDVCTVVDSATLTFLAEYEDDCGTDFTTPNTLATVNFNQEPDVEVEGGSFPRLALNESGSFTLSLSANEENSLDDDPLQVTYALPGAITGGTTLTPSSGTTSCAGSCGPGDIVTWSVPRSSLSSNQTLQIGVTATGDSCQAGAEYSSPINISTSFASNVCPLSDTDSAGFLLSANPYAAPQQSFNQIGSAFETGAPDDGNGLHEEGEGEQAQFLATYLFDAADPGTWTGSKYEDGFGGLSQAVLNVSSLEYQLNSGAWTAVPIASIMGGMGSFSIELDFLAGIDSADNVGGDDLRIRYSITAPDAVLGGSEYIYRSQFNALTISNGLNNGASCPSGNDAVYRQGDRVQWRRARGEIEVSLNDEIIDVCEVSNATVRINNQANEFGIRNLLARLNLGSAYELVTPSNPVFSGGLGGPANVTYNAVDPSFSLDDEKLLATGTATIQVRRKATATNSGGSISATLDYDDMETAPAGLRSFTATSSDTPVLVNQANLDIFVSPKNLPAIGNNVQWDITIRNTDSGVAYDAALEDVVPNGLIVTAEDISAMNAANPGFPVSHSSGTLTWNLGNVSPGDAQKITVVASFDGSTCNISNGPSNQISSSWGCGGFRAQDVSAARPNLQFPTGNLQILHDTTGAYAELCGAGQVIIIVNNAGLSEINSVVVTEQLNTAGTGISFEPGSAEYSTDNGDSWTPAGAVTAASTLAFDESNIPPLSMLAGNGATGSKVLIRFSISTNATTNSDSEITVSGTGDLHCGDPVTSAGSTFDVPLDRPSLRVTKVGRNLTTSSSNSENIYAAPGDIVEWSVTVKNEGDLTTQELRFRDILASSGGSATITGPGLNKTVTSFYEPIPQLGTNQTAIYTITETVGLSCVNDVNVADVTWGCSAAPVGQASELSSPIDNSDGANLVMLPSNALIQLSQTINGPGGVGGLTTAGQVQITIANIGAPFTSAVLENDLPEGFRYDPSFTPIISNSDTGGDAYNAVTVDASNAKQPEFTITRGGGAGYLRNDATLVLTFGIYQDGSLDTSGDSNVVEEDVGSSDPAVPVDSTNNVTLIYESGCGLAGSKSISSSVAPKTPDLDVSFSSPTGPTFVTGAGDSKIYAIEVTNNGDTSAENGLLEIALGTGWSGATPSGCSGTIPGNLSCDLSGANALGTGASRTFTLNLTVANETGTLDVFGTVTGQITDSVDANTGGTYSFDEIETQTLGFRQTLEVLSTSEVDFAGADELQIGEDVTLRIHSIWFGAGTATIENPAVSLNFQRLSEMDYISESVTSGQSITSQSNFGSSAPNDIIYEFADFTGGATITIDVVARVLNNANTTAGKTFEFVSHAENQLASLTFDRNISGYPEVQDRNESFTFRRPIVTVAKQVRNKTLAGSFSDTAEGDAGDVFEYRITLENTGDAPAFDLSIVDTVPNDFLINAFAGDSLDNDGDGSADEAAEGGVAGQVITFDRTTGNEGKLAQLAVGATLTLLYETNAQSGVHPNIDAINSADYEFDSLNLATGSQSTPTGGTGTQRGAYTDNGNVTATVTIIEIALNKALITTSVGGDDSLEVVVGEQAEFELSLALPAGTVEDLVVEDVLPEGLALFSRGAIQYGGSVSCPSTSETPIVLPASGAPLTASWDFGDCTVAQGTEIERTVKVTYIAQVENISAVTANTDLVNAAEFTHSVTTDAVLAEPVTLTVTEPQLSLTMSASPNNNVDAGDDVTVVFTLSNSGSAPSFNLDLVSLLNDNSVDGGADEDVNVSAAFGDNLRDIEVFDCSVNPVDTSGALGDFTFSIVTDADGDANPADNAADCGVLYRNVDTDGFVAGANIIFSARLRTGINIISDSDYIIASLAKSSSLPSGVTGSGDADYERSASNDASSSGKYEASTSTTLASRNLPSSLKTFTASSDPNTLPDSGNAINVGVGETYQAQITYRFDEGTARRIELADRVRLNGVNIPAQVELVRAKLSRSSLGLTAETDPAGINAAVAGVFVDVTSLFTNAVSGTWQRYALDMGDVVHSGDNGSLNLTQDIQSYVIEYDFRVKDVSDNKDSLVLRDQGQTRRYNAQNLSEGNRNGQGRNVTIVEPSFLASKTSADVDGILSGNETVSYTLTALNQGSGPAYNTVIEDVLPPSLRANGLSSVSILVDGVAPSSAPIFTYNSASGLARWKFSNADIVMPSKAISITYDAQADPSVPAGTSHTNAFSIAAYYTQKDTQLIERRQESRSNIASVTLGAPEIAFRPDQTETTQPGAAIVYPHILTLPSTLSSASLSFVDTGSQNLNWTIWYDADGNGQLSTGDQRWIDGTNAPKVGELQFFMQAQIPQNTHDGWRDITTFTVNVTKGAAVLSGQVTDITYVNALQAGELQAGKSMAVDRDCDGNLTGETVTDATFEQTKDAAPGECIIYRITFTNSGTGRVSNVNVKDMTPSYTVYLNGSASYETTPAGLLPQSAITPAANQNGPVSFPYSGSMQSGGTGAVTYGVRINE